MAIAQRCEMKKQITCIHCQTVYELELNPQALMEWQGGKFAQDAFPDLTSGQRELLISGTCDTCWNRFFPNDDDE